MEALRIEGLHKNFGGIQVLRDLSFSVQAGEKVAVIGPNGAGKTTLLNVITGVLKATAGQINLLGQDINHMPAYRRVHIGLAYSFQITRLFHDLTVLQNIQLAVQGTKPYRYQLFRPITAYDEVLARSREFLDLIDLWDKRNQLMKEVSYGEQRKMEIILSLASQPKVLLLDEPTAGLALTEIPKFINTIKALSKEITVIFIAHDMDVVFGLAERIAVLYSGQFIAQGTPEEIQNNPLVKEIYLGLEEDATNARIS